MKKSKTQEQIILQHFKRKKTITSFEAFTKYYITRLSAVIWTLRKHGYDIATDMQYKDGKSYAIYRRNF